jgi:hypothetical protein
MELFFKKDLAFENEYKDLYKDLKFLEKYEHLTIHELLNNDVFMTYFNTLVSYLYKGDVKVDQDFSLKSVKGSML